MFGAWWLRVVGILLLVSAGLKAHGLMTDPLQAELLGFTPTLQLYAIEIELFLAVWLLSGWAVKQVWWLTICFFLVVTGISAKMAWEGYSSCGCFGRISVNPWITLALDLAVCTVLLLVRKKVKAQASQEGTRDYPFLLTLKYALAIIALCGIITTVFGNELRLTWSTWLGEAVRLEPHITQLDDGQSSTVSTTTVSIINISQSSVKILGGTASCSCIATQDLPLTLLPGESRTMHVMVKRNGSPGRFMQRYHLFTNVPGQAKVYGAITGTILQKK